MTDQEKNAQIKQTVRNMRALCVVAPFAQLQPQLNVNSFDIIGATLSNFVGVYLLCLFSRVLLSWFPVFNWERQPWLAVRQVTDPYLNLFRGILPPLLGSVDFTPLLGFFLLQFFADFLDTDDPNELDLDDVYDQMEMEDDHPEANLCKAVYADLRGFEDMGSSDTD